VTESIFEWIVRNIIITSMMLDCMWWEL
jgi:hypothetical protein